MPEVVADPLGEVAQTFQNLGVCVVQQCAKIRQQGTFTFLSTIALLLSNTFKRNCSMSGSL